MFTSTDLKAIITEARPVIERQLDDAEIIAGFRTKVTDAGGDWGQVKALVKAIIQDERDEAGGNKRVTALLEKADHVTGYADMLGIGNLNEKNSFGGDDDEASEHAAPAAGRPRLAEQTAAGVRERPDVSVAAADRRALAQQADEHSAAGDDSGEPEALNHSPDAGKMVGFVAGLTPAQRQAAFDPATIDDMTGEIIEHEPALTAAATGADKPDAHAEQSAPVTESTAENVGGSAGRLHSSQQLPTGSTASVSAVDTIPQPGIEPVGGELGQAPAAQFRVTAGGKSIPHRGEISAA